MMAGDAGVIIFVHVPKTAGRTLVSILTRELPAEACRQVAGSLPRVIADLGALSAAARRDLRCVFGHVPFGLHAALPAPARYVTLLRDPVERFVSAYFYALREPSWGAHRVIRDRRLSLDDFARSEAGAALHNEQTRMLGGTGEPRLAQALDNLRRFASVGLTERFDEFALSCRRRFGWASALHVPQNVNRERCRLAEIPRETRAAIEGFNTLDLELYASARRRFEADLEAAPIPGDELERFCRLNRAYRLASTVERAGALRREHAPPPGVSGE